MFEPHKAKACEFMRRQGELRGYHVTEKWLWPCRGTVTVARGSTPVFEVRFEFDDARQRAEIVRIEGASSSRRGRETSMTYGFRHDDRRSKDLCITALLNEFEAHFTSFPDRVREIVQDASSVDADDFRELNEEAEEFFGERAQERLLLSENGTHHLVSVFGDRFSGWVTVVRVDGVEIDDLGKPDLSQACLALDHVEYVPYLDDLRDYLEAASENSAKPEA